MNTKEIPKGFWLNVTVMARYDPQFIVGVLRQGKASWITEGVKGHFDNPEDAYKWGMDWIEKYQLKKSNQIELELPTSHCGTTGGYPMANERPDKYESIYLGRGQWEHTLITKKE